MRILYVHNNADLYGSSRSLLRLSSRLVLDGHEIHVLMPYRGDLDKSLEAAGCTVHIMNGLAIIERSVFKSIGSLIAFMLKMPLSIICIMRLINKIKPDIVHSNTSVMLSSALAGRLSKVSNIWHIREFYTEFPLFWKFYERVIGFCSDQVICVSKAVQDQFLLPTNLQKTTVIHNGFPDEEFQVVSEERIIRFKEAHDLTGFILVGLVGRIILQRKGQDVFAHTAALLKDQFQNVKYVLIGDCFPGNEHHLTNLKELIKNLNVSDSVVLTGKAVDIQACYASLDISVLASAKPEPFGGVTIESMAFGKPVIGTNIGGTPEQIKDGQTGILIPPDDPHAMAEAIARLIDDQALRLRMGKAGRKRFEQEFGFEPYYEKIMRKYRRVFYA